MSFLDILVTALGNLWKNKVRTILTILAVFVGAFAIALTVGMNIGVNGFVNREIGGMGAKDIIFVMPKDSSAAGNSNAPKKYNPKVNATVAGFTGQGTMLSQADKTKLKGLSGVKNVQVAQSPTFDYVQAKNGDKYQLTASTVVPSLNITILAGKQVPLKAKDNEIVLNETYVKALGFKNNQAAINQEVTLRYSATTGQSAQLKAKIVGIQQSNVAISGADAWVNEALTDKVLALNNQGLPDSIVNSYAQLQVEVTHVSQVNQVRRAIEKAGYTAQTFTDQVKAITNVTNAITGGLVLFAVVTLLAATFGIVNTLYMSVQDRTKEIGLMKALGLSRGKVFSIFSWEATLIGFFGSLLGLLFAMLVGAGIDVAAGRTFLKGLPNFKLISFELVPSLWIILLIMAIAFVAGTLPARKASRLDPIAALRSE